MSTADAAFSEEQPQQVPDRLERRTDRSFLEAPCMRSLMQDLANDLLKAKPYLASQELRIHVSMSVSLKRQFSRMSERLAHSQRQTTDSEFSQWIREALRSSVERADFFAHLRIAAVEGANRELALEGLPQTSILPKLTALAAARAFTLFPNLGEHGFEVARTDAQTHLLRQLWQDKFREAANLSDGALMNYTTTTLDHAAIDSIKQQLQLQLTGPRVIFPGEALSELWEPANFATSPELLANHDKAALLYLENPGLQEVFLTCNQVLRSGLAQGSDGVFEAAADWINRSANSFLQCPVSAEEVEIMFAKATRLLWLKVLWLLAKRGLIHDITMHVGLLTLKGKARFAIARELGISVPDVCDSQNRAKQALGGLWPLD